MQESSKINLLRQILWFAICIVGGLLIGQLLSIVVAKAMGVGNITHFMEEVQKGNYPERLNSVKLLYLVTHFGLYTFSALSFAWLLKRTKIMTYLYLSRWSTISTIVLVLVAACAAYPAAIGLYYINLQIIPESWVAQDTINLQAKLMLMETPIDLILNLLLVGVVAGVGEELIFRGIVQRFIVQASKQKHWAVWGTALLFSLIHFQPEGFIPRFLLGAFLGYLLIWTGSLWNSILAHVSFNSIQVLLFYIFPQPEPELSASELPDFSAWLSLSMLGLLIFVCYLIWKINQSKQLQTLSYSHIE